jgi:hypothetical protein
MELAPIYAAKYYRQRYPEFHPGIIQIYRPLVSDVWIQRPRTFVLTLEITMAVPFYF